MPDKKNKVKMTLTDFKARVYRACLKIPRGRITTYGELARFIKHPSAGRAVGNALNRNPFAPNVPCHRVVRSDGNIGGFAGGRAAKSRLLRVEGIVIRKNKIELKRYLFRYR